jgi:hypothetical protein
MRCGPALFFVGGGDRTPANFEFINMVFKNA